MSRKESNGQYAKATAALKKNDYRVLKQMPKSYIRPNVTHDDDAFSVANCSKRGMRLNTHQVRILRRSQKGWQGNGSIGACCRCRSGQKTTARRGSTACGTCRSVSS